MEGINEVVNTVLAKDTIRFFPYVFLIDRKRNRRIALQISALNSEDASELATRAAKEDCEFKDSPADCLKELKLFELLREDSLGEKNWEFMTQSEIDDFCNQTPAFLENETSFNENGNKWASDDGSNGNDEAI